MADAVLDVHQGMAMGIFDHSGRRMRPCGSQDVINKSKAMAYAFGIQHIIPFQWELTHRSDAIWAGSAAVALDIPSIDVEAGGKGIVDDEAIAAIEEGFHRTLAHLGMTEKVYPSPQEQKLIYDRQSIKSPIDGSWVALKSAGETVSEGQLLGYVPTGMGGVFDVRSPKGGLLMLRLSAPPVQEGETLVVVASTRAAWSKK